MGVSVRGHSDPHLHSPCPQCGYATRYKHFGPMRCACPNPKPRPRRVVCLSGVIGVARVSLPASPVSLGQWEWSFRSLLFLPLVGAVFCQRK
jgi:hypothetical protein